MGIAFNVKEYIDSKIKDLQQQVSTFKRKPCLAIISADGYDDSSSVYIRNKINLAKKIGIDVILCGIEWEDTPAHEFRNYLFNLIDKLNEDEKIDGIIVQLPCPFVQEFEIADRIITFKDVDGFHFENQGAIMRGDTPIFYPCTPLGAINLLKEFNIDIEGKTCAVVGRSNIVGRPLASMLTTAGATVIHCNSKTPDLKTMTSQADIVFLATGNAKLFTKEYFKKDSICIDFGINRDENNKLCGDLDISNCSETLSYWTSTPGGTGPLTVLSLIEQTIESYKFKYEYDYDDFGYIPF